MALYLEELGAAPGTPASGKGVVYAKTDGKLYFKNDAGTETELKSGGITIPTTKLDNFSACAHGSEPGASCWIQCEPAGANCSNVVCMNCTNVITGTNIPLLYVCSYVCSPGAAELCTYAYAQSCCVESNKHLMFRYYLMGQSTQFSQGGGNSVIFIGNATDGWTSVACLTWAGGRAAAVCSPGTLQVIPLGTNCYLLYGDSSNCLSLPNGLQFLACTCTHSDTCRPIIGQVFIDQVWQG